jgi:hypothetical protein
MIRLYAGAGGKGGNATATDAPTEHRPMYVLPRLTHIADVARQEAVNLRRSG